MDVALMSRSFNGSAPAELTKALDWDMGMILLRLHSKLLKRHLGIFVIYARARILTLSQDRLLLALSHSAWHWSPQNYLLHTAKKKQALWVSQDTIFTYERVNRFFQLTILSTDKDVIKLVFHRARRDVNRHILESKLLWNVQTSCLSSTIIKQYRTSLLVQWLRICLPIQGTWVPSLVWEDPTGHRTTKSVCPNYWACALEPGLCRKRSHCKENSHTATREKPLQAATKTRHSQHK